MKEQNALGILEFASIYKGFEVEDTLLKSTRITKLLARTICSGKFLFMFRGEIADVEEALDLASEQGGFAIISRTIVTSVDERVFPALVGATTLDTDEVDGMAVIETFSVATAIKAADEAVKEADITILRIHVAMAVGGKGYVVLTGNIDALKSALTPAIDYLKDEGTLAGYTLITHPHKDVLNDLI